MDRSRLSGHEDLSEWLGRLRLFLSFLKDIDINTVGLQRVSLVLNQLIELTESDTVLLIREEDLLTSQVMVAQPVNNNIPNFRTRIYKAYLSIHKPGPEFLEDSEILHNLKFLLGTDASCAVLIPLSSLHFEGVVVVGWNRKIITDDFFRLFFSCCQIQLREIVEVISIQHKYEQGIQQFQTLTRYISQGFLFINDNAPTVYVNEAASQWLKVPPGEHPADHVSKSMYELRMAAVNQEEISEYVMKLFTQSVIKDWIWKYNEPKPLILKVACIPLHSAGWNGKLWLFDDVTPEIQLQEELSSVNDRLAERSHFIELINMTLPNRVAVVDITTITPVYVNKEEYKHILLTDIVHPDDYEDHIQYYKGFINAADLEIRHIYFRMKDSDGTYHYMKINGSVFHRDKDGIPDQVLVIVEDITQLKNAEIDLKKTILDLKKSQEILNRLNEELHAVNEEFAISHNQLLEQKVFTDRIISTIPSTVFIIDLSSQQTIYMSREEMGGLMVELYPANSLSNFVIHPDDFDRYSLFFENAMNTQDDEVRKIEVRIRHTQKKYYNLLVRQTVFRRNAEGIPDQFIGTSQDITYLKDTETALENIIYQLEEKQKEADALNEELIASNEELTASNEELLVLTEQMKVATLEIQRLATEKLQISEQKYMDLTENMQEIFVVVDKDLRYIYVNKATEAQVGLGRNYILGKRSYELFGEEISQDIESYLQSVIDTGISINTRTNFQYKGRSLYLILNIYPTIVGAFAIIQNVTDMVMAEFRFKDLAESITDPIVMLDQDFRYIYWNRATEQTIGIKLENVFGKTPQEVLGKEYYHTYQDRFDLYKQVMKTGVQEIIFNTIERNGKTAYVEIAVYPTQQGGVLAITRDITARVEAERNYHELGESITDVILLLDKDLCYQYMNAAGEAYTGLKLSEVLGRNVIEVLDENLGENYLNLAQRRLDVYRKVMETGVSMELNDIGYYGKDERRLHIYVYPSSRGGILVISRDVTNLFQAEQNYRDLADSITDIFFALDKDLRYIYYNRASEAFTGKSAEQITGKSVYEVLPTIKGSVIEQKILQVLNEKTVQSFTNEYTTKGQTYYHRMYFYPTKSGVSVIARDITERMQLSKKLEEEKQQLELALRSGELGLWDWNIQTGDIYYNEQWLALLEYQPGELTPRIENWLDLIHPEDLELVTVTLDNHLHNKTSDYHAELRLLTKSGNWKWIYDTGKVIVRDEKGNPLRATGVIMDITQKKQYELKIEQLNEELEQKVKERTAQLIAANKELEAFSYSVSHDLRIPLRSIDGFSKALQEDYAEVLNAEGNEYLNTIRIATQRMGQLIEDLMKLAKVTRTEITKEFVNLSHMATAILNDLMREYPQRKVITLIEEDIMVMGDEKLLGIALQNLLGNAWKYTGKREKSVIELKKLVTEEGEVYLIKDNGVGFDMKHADKLFNPFQRLHSKRDFEGTGVGLATVQRIIVKHGGRIWAEAAPDKGSTFYFTLGEMF